MGFFDALTDVASSVKKDAFDIISGKPVIQFAASLPHQMAQIKALTGFSGRDEYNKAQQETGMSFHPGMDFGDYLRNAARTPVFSSFVPGLSTAANLTSNQGRQQIMQHPLPTALDVASLAAMGYGAAGKAGAGPALPEAEMTLPNQVPNTLGETMWNRFLGRPKNWNQENYNALGDAIEASMEGKRLSELRTGLGYVNRSANNPWTRGGPLYDIAPKSTLPTGVTLGVTAGMTALDILHQMFGPPENPPIRQLGVLGVGWQPKFPVTERGRNVR
jgi:hypothetical protein